MILGKSFAVIFKKNVSMKKIRLDRLKMNANLMFSKDNLNEYVRLNDEYFSEVQKLLHFKNKNIR